METRGEEEEERVRKRVMETRGEEEEERVRKRVMETRGEEEGEIHADRDKDQQRGK